MYSHSDSMEDTRKYDRKGDGPLMASSRDDATPVRDEPMDAAAVPHYKSASDKEKKEKMKGKVEKVKRKAENSSASKKESSGKTSSKSSKHKTGDLERLGERLGEPPFKRTKEDLPHKTDGIKMPSAVKEEKALLPRKVPKQAKHHQDVKPSKEDSKSKKDPTIKSDKGLVKEAKPKKDVEKSIKTEEKHLVKAGEAKPEKRRRKEDGGSAKEIDMPSTKPLSVDVPEMARVSPKPKIKAEVEKPPEKIKPAIPPLMDIKPGPLRKIKINREIGKRISTEMAPSPEPADLAQKPRPEKSRGKMRRRVQAVDGSGSLLVDYTR